MNSLVPPSSMPRNIFEKEKENVFKRFDRELSTEESFLFNNFRPMKNIINERGDEI